MHSSRPRRNVCRPRIFPDWIFTWGGGLQAASPRSRSYAAPAGGCTSDRICCYRVEMMRFLRSAVMGMMMIGAAAPSAAQQRGTYQDLLALFEDWRAFEVPPKRDGAPDYTAATF